MSLRTIATSVAAVAVLATASTAFGGAITNATGPFQVDGKQVTLKPGQTLPLKQGQVIDTGASKVTFTSSAGDPIVLEAGAKARADGDDGFRDSLFLGRGVGIATLSQKTTFGAATGWVTAGAAATEKIQVFVDVPADRANNEALFRATKGEAYVSYYQFNAYLPERHAITLTTDTGNSGVVCYRTHQSNPATVRIEKKVQGGTIIAEVPRATSGCSRPEQGDTKTRIDNAISSSFKTGKILVSTDFGEGAGEASELGPGAYALVDNTTGEITVGFPDVEVDILQRAVTLTTEFATLTQSNFSDVE